MAGTKADGTGAGAFEARRYGPGIFRPLSSRAERGQQQRIGVLRALAAEPPLILMDEPFGALDPITRDSLQEEFKKLQRTLNKTIVFVTHDMDEAIKLADRIVILKAGEIVQVGTPDDILRNPANEFVEEFIGKERLLQSRPDIERVEQMMNKKPVTVTADKTLSQAIQVMREHRVDSLLVVDDLNVLQGYVDVEIIDQNRKKRASSATCSALICIRSSRVHCCVIPYAKF